MEHWFRFISGESRTAGFLSNDSQQPVANPEWHPIRKIVELLLFRFKFEKNHQRKSRIKKEIFNENKNQTGFTKCQGA